MQRPTHKSDLPEKMPPAVHPETAMEIPTTTKTPSPEPEKKRSPPGCRSGEKSTPRETAATGAMLHESFSILKTREILQSSTWRNRNCGRANIRLRDRYHVDAMAWY
ncbi:MAG TPA: hypothetical protein EYP57_08660 [Thermodesulfobacteriaceae bacterium]|nr:hypothetical protein [Thermodesulfobacteriaceae bacterium]